MPWGGLYVVLAPEPSVHVLLDEEVSEWLDGHRAAGPRARAHRGQVRRRSSNTRRHGLCVGSFVVLGSFGSKLRSCGRCAVAKCLVLSGKRTKTPVFNDAEPMEDDALDMLLMEDGGGALFDDTDESMPAEGAANSGREFFGMIDA